MNNNLNDLIIIREDAVLLDAEASNRILEFEKQIKLIKEQEELFKQRILKEMEDKNILQIKTDNMTISYVAPTYRETFDIKKFKEEHPKQYNNYIKMSEVKSSVRIKIDN